MQESLRKITRGTAIAFSGSVIALLLTFGGRATVARLGSEAEYGAFALLLAILTILATIATLGLQQGVVRSIAFARSRDDAGKVKALIATSVRLCLVSSTVFGLLLFFTSAVVASGVFDDETLVRPLRVVAVGIPFFTLATVLASSFQGFDDVRPRVLFQDILRNGVFLLFLVPVALLDLPFDSVFYAFLASLFVSFAVLALLANRRFSLLAITLRRVTYKPEAKELVLISLPLLGVAALHTMTAWTDTLMLGAWRTSAEVGLYNAAGPLARFISFPLSAMLLIYLPVASSLYARRSLAELRRNFSILTKWLCAVTLPLFLVLFMFPETALEYTFGSGYVSAAPTLRILCTGVIIGNLLGPNGATLVALGEVRFIMWATLAVALLNVGLNIALIPPLGIEGAAIATVASITSVNLIRAWKLHSVSRVQPLSRNLFKSSVTFLVLAYVVFLIVSRLFDIHWWMIPLLLVLFYGLFALGMLLTRSIDDEDMAILASVKTGVAAGAGRARRIVRKVL